VKRRYKLRVRTYDDHPEAPVFFEIKHRINDTVVKERGIVHRSAVDSLLAGRMPTPDDMAASGRDHLEAVEHFSQLMHELQATPRARVRYWREPWVSRVDANVRLTFDRDVLVSPVAGTGELWASTANPARPFGDSVILEIKFTGRAPAWLHDLTRISGLRRSSAAKYCDGVLAGGAERFSPDGLRARDLQRFSKAEARLNRLAPAPAFSGTAPSFA
jgi:hypothetical protein